MLEWVGGGWVGVIAPIACVGFAVRAVEKAIAERDRKRQMVIEGLWRHVGEMEARAERRERHILDKIEELKKDMGEARIRRDFAERLVGIDKMTSEQMGMGNLLGLVNDVLEKGTPEHEEDMSTR